MGGDAARGGSRSAGWPGISLSGLPVVEAAPRVGGARGPVLDRSHCRSSARHVDRLKDVRGGRRRRRVPQDSGEVTASQLSGVGELTGSSAATAHAVGSKSRREPAGGKQGAP